MSKCVIAYVPVVHQGYLNFFKKHAPINAIFVLGKGVTDLYKPLTKDINAISAKDVVLFIKTLNLAEKVEVVDDVDKIISLVGQYEQIIVPDEDVMRDLLSGKQEKIVWDSIFLRWDKHRAMESVPVAMDQTISKEVFDREIIANLKDVSEKRSSCFWRRIGAAVIKNGEVIMTAYNKHRPHEQEPYIHGDPRNNFSKGINIEISSSHHAEAQLIAEAARRGISLEGASLYTSVFPCPPCAKQVAYAGIKKLYYGGGYSVLNQERVLRSQGVEIIYVEGESEN